MYTFIAIVATHVVILNFENIFNSTCSLTLIQQSTYYFQEPWHFWDSGLGPL